MVTAAACPKLESRVVVLGGRTHWWFLRPVRIYMISLEVALKAKLAAAKCGQTRRKNTKSRGVLTLQHPGGARRPE